MTSLKRFSLLIVAVIMTVLLSSCDQIIPMENVTPDATAAVVIKPIEIKAADTPTPEPVIIVREPVKSHSAMRIQQDAPVTASVPAFYQAIDLEGVNYCVYAFTNSDGKTEFRVYAEVDELEDENVMNTLQGFFKAEVYLNGEDYYIQTNKDDNPLNPSTETPCKYNPCLPPTKNNIRSYIRNMESEKKKYERAVANAEKKGEPLPEPTPYDGLPIYTEETEVINIPSQVKVYKRDQTHYYYMDVYGEEAHRVYATPNGIVSGFCLSDESGKVMAGSLMIDYNLDFAKENFKQRKLQEKPEDGIYRLPVYITLNSGETQTVSMVYLVEETAEE